MKDFRDEIEKQLTGLSRKQICQFAWLCAVRALPFLSAERRGFDYWEENVRQKHLYSIFNALDICVAAAADARDVAYAAAAADVAYA
ncbi:MAG: hypothetical protein FWE67_07920, partial [Planctomycetaceae bacterium]|nr:hypothetical protein [Planctomycetaceae bacterium]